MAKKPPPRLGRQKIKIAKIEKPNHRQVTFSKRRSGLFKKASELCTLYGVQMAVLVFSPAGKAFSFGHPSVESIVQRFLGRADLANNAYASSREWSAVRELDAQLARFNELIGEEKARKESLARVKEWWWEEPVQRHGRSQLERLAESLRELKKRVELETVVAKEMANLVS